MKLACGLPIAVASLRLELGDELAVRGVPGHQAGGVSDPEKASQGGAVGRERQALALPVEVALLLELVLARHPPVRQVVDLQLVLPTEHERHVAAAGGESDRLGLEVGRCFKPEKPLAALEVPDLEHLGEVRPEDDLSSAGPGKVGDVVNVLAVVGDPRDPGGAGDVPDVEVLGLEESVGDEISAVGAEGLGLEDVDLALEPADAGGRAEVPDLAVVLVVRVVAEHDEGAGRGRIDDVIAAEVRGDGDRQLGDDRELDRLRGGVGLDPPGGRERRRPTYCRAESRAWASLASTGPGLPAPSPPRRRGPPRRPSPHHPSRPAAGRGRGERDGEHHRRPRPAHAPPPASQTQGGTPAAAGRRPPPRGMSLSLAPAPGDAVASPKS